MKTLLLVTLLGLTTMLLNCQAEEPDALTADEEMQLREEITARYNGWMAAANRANIDSCALFLAEDIQFASNSQLLYGRETMVETYRPRFARIDHQNIATDTSHIILLSPGIAIQSAEATNFSKDAAGDTTSSSNIAFTFVWAKQDGEWFCRQAHQSMRRTN